MHITPYAPEHRDAFEEMLVEYFVRDLDSDIPEDILRSKLMPHIEGYVLKGITHLALAMEGDTPIGCSIYQIDTPDSDWCKRPGWGFIREFWIAKDHRGKSYGRALADHTEQQLHALGASQLYLTSDNAIGFWERCGWRNTHEVCTNGLEILVK